MDGEWEAPQIPNPACETAPGCGEWKRPTINNPQYKGKWKAPLVDNSNYQVTIILTKLCTVYCSYIYCFSFLKHERLCDHYSTKPKDS